MKIAAGASFGNGEMVVEGKPVDGSLSETIENRPTREQEVDCISEHQQTRDLSYCGYFCSPNKRGMRESSSSMEDKTFYRSKIDAFREARVPIIEHPDQTPEWVKMPL
jgi:hypothetical protein